MIVFKKEILTAFGFYLYSLLAKFGFIPAPAWVTSYLADILCIPILLALVLSAIRLVKRDRTIWLSIGMIIVAVVATSLYFEFYLPTTSAEYIGDRFDILCYLFGGYLYFIYQRRLKKSLLKSHN